MTQKSSKNKNKSKKSQCLRLILCFQVTFPCTDTDRGVGRKGRFSTGPNEVGSGISFSSLRSTLDLIQCWWAGWVLLTANYKFKVSEKSDSFLISRFQLHSDVDTGNGNIKYILSGEGAGTTFVIDDKTGNIHATKTLDREEQAQYTLTAQAVDRHTNKPLEPPSEFIVKVQDINDNPPEFLHGPYYARVPEMSNVGELKKKFTSNNY